MATMLATSLLLMVCLAGLLVTTTVAQEGRCDSSNVGKTQRDPNDCGMYFMCMFNRWNHRSCRNGTAFNEETVTCVSPRDVAGCYSSAIKMASPSVRILLLACLVASSMAGYISYGIGYPGFGFGGMGLGGMGLGGMGLGGMGFGGLGFGGLGFGGLGFGGLGYPGFGFGGFGRGFYGKKYY